MERWHKLKRNIDMTRRPSTVSHIGKTVSGMGLRSTIHWGVSAVHAFAHCVLGSRGREKVTEFVSRCANHIEVGVAASDKNGRLVGHFSLLKCRMA